MIMKIFYGEVREIEERSLALTIADESGFAKSLRVLSIKFTGLFWNCGKNCRLCMFFLAGLYKMIMVSLWMTLLEKNSVFRTG
ncbi:MAG: hypothetical protein KDJ26_04315 [Alphaproteobacteria bacterium]|nr:hypothetical protein [Alphaproteobacteria bacterium]MCB9985220.1 hypothetical protein [Micavibrio sp.]